LADWCLKMATEQGYPKEKKPEDEEEIEEKTSPLDLIGHLGWYNAYRKFWARIKKEAKKK